MAKKNTPSHTAPTQKGSGTFYGTGTKAPVGKSRSDSMANPVTGKKLKIPPKKLA